MMMAWVRDFTAVSRTILTWRSISQAPSADFGEQDLYPEFVDKAAVLLVRLAKNHPLLDGNKRAAWVTLRLFIEMNEWSWNPYPSIDDSEQAVVSVASGQWNEERTAEWLRIYLIAPHAPES